MSFVHVSPPTFLFSQYVPHAAFRPVWFYDRNNIWWGSLVKKHFIVYISPFYYTFFLLGPNTVLSTPFSKTLKLFTSNLIIFQQDVTVFSLLHFCRQLYMFRMLTPIIRSSYSCTYSFCYWLTGSTTIRSRCSVGSDSCISTTYRTMHMNHFQLNNESGW